MKTLQELARESLSVQDASNLSGVVKGFARATSDLWAHADALGHGTEWVNTHPISVLWANKISSLAGNDFSAAYSAVNALAEGIKAQP